MYDGLIDSHFCKNVRAMGWMKRLLCKHDWFVTWTILDRHTGRWIHAREAKAKCECLKCDNKRNYHYKHIEKGNYNSKVFLLMSLNVKHGNSKHIDLSGA